LNARLPMLVAIVAVLALVAGCGSGDDEGGSVEVTASSLSKPAFVKEASAICERARGKLVAIKQPLPKAIPATVLPAMESMVEEISELGAPSGDEAEVEAFLQAMQQETESLDEKQASISSFGKLEEEFKTSGGLAKKYGMPKCAFYARFSTS